MSLQQRLKQSKSLPQPNLNPSSSRNLSGIALSPIALKTPKADPCAGNGPGFPTARFCYYTFALTIFTNTAKAEIRRNKGLSMRREFQNRISILAVCTGNICRSPMAEGILRKMLSVDPDITVSSAGTHALEGNPATEFAVIAARERGIDISGHRARMLTPEHIENSRIILCMEPFHVEWVLALDVSASGRIFTLAEFSGGDAGRKTIPDPYGCSLREYRECFRDIHLCLGNFIASKKECLTRM
jgi:protein-tyrosine-phosphatase